MNFLAHIHLSGTDTALQIGNFLGDFVVGDLQHKRNAYLSAPMKKGVILHRKIDAFTDQHPAVRACTKRLMPNYHKFSGIIVDVFFDHFLAKYWPKFSSHGILDFTESFYQALLSQQPNLPQAFEPLIHSITTHKWLANYVHLEGVRRSLTSISKRATFQSGIENAVETLENDGAFFEAQFLLFYPQMLTFCAAEIQKFHEHSNA
jgi:acyl carrier protein phosphodiesterase